MTDPLGDLAAALTLDPPAKDSLLLALPTGEQEPSSRSGRRVCSTQRARRAGRCGRQGRRGTGHLTPMTDTDD